MKKDLTVGILVSGLFAIVALMVFVVLPPVGLVVDRAVPVHPVELSPSNPPPPREVKTQDAPAATEPVMNISVKTAKDGRYVKVEYVGSVNLPTGTRIHLRIFDMGESVVSGKIVPLATPTSRRIFVREGKFKGILFTRTIGNYQLHVTVPPKSQEPKVKAQLDNVPGLRSWKFKVRGWDDSIIKQLGPGLDEMDNLILECKRVVESYKTAFSSEANFIKSEKKIIVLGKKFQRKLRASKASALYTAAFGQLDLSIGELRVRIDASARQARTRVNHRDPDKELWMNARGEIDFDVLNWYVNEASVTSGRELCLWAIGLIRDNDGEVGEELTGLLTKYAEHPGVSPYVKELLTPEMELIDRLESRVRSAGK